MHITTELNIKPHLVLTLNLGWYLYTLLPLKSVHMHIPTEGCPSCLHTTIASSFPHTWLSHTVPQNPSTQISTLPSLSLSPPTRRRSPELHSGWEVAEGPLQIAPAIERSLYKRREEHFDRV